MRWKISAFIQPMHVLKKAKMSHNVPSLTETMPQKCKDSETLSIPCTIGDSKFENYMLGLGASINIMFTSFYNNLNLGPLHNTSLTIQLVNISNICPVGVVEDVLVQVNDLIFSTDFYILDMEGKINSKSSKTPIILGIPFL